MSSQRRTTPEREGWAALAFSCWCLFWMVQPALYWSALTRLRWFGLPAHYAFWLIGMVGVIPASCFAFTLWANRRASRRRRDGRGGGGA